MDSGGRTSRWSPTIRWDPSQSSPPSRSAPTRSCAYWDGQRLVSKRGERAAGRPCRCKQALTLDAEGTEMTIERMVIVQHGYTLRGTKNYADRVKDVSTRARRS